MGPRAVQSSARTLRLRLPSLYQVSFLPSPPLYQAQTPLQRATTHCYSRFASLSSSSTPTTPSAVGQQPLPKGFQLKSSLDKCYIIDEVLSERPAYGRVWCVYRAMYVRPFFIISLVYSRTGNSDHLPIFKTQGAALHSQRHY